MIEKMIINSKVMCLGFYVSYIFSVHTMLLLAE